MKFFADMAVVRLLCKDHHPRKTTVMCPGAVLYRLALRLQDAANTKTEGELIQIAVKPATIAGGKSQAGCFRSQSDLWFDVHEML